MNILLIIVIRPYGINMSGIFVSTGLITNNIEKKLKLKGIMDLIKEDLSIQIIPLKLNSGVSFARIAGKALQQLIHPAIFSPTLSHIAIQLNLENNYIVIIEYGQYFSNDSELNNTNIFSSCSKYSNTSNNISRSENNNLLYFYINKDGARITLINTKEKGINSDKIALFSKEEISAFVLSVIAANHYGLSLEDFEKEKFKLSSINDFHTIDCVIKNKITLRKLCKYFRGKN